MTMTYIDVLRTVILCQGEEHSDAITYGIVPIVAPAVVLEKRAFVKLIRGANLNLFCLSKSTY